MPTLEIVEERPSPGPGPAGLAWDGRTLWNADFRRGRIFGLDLATGEAGESLICPGVLSGLAWDGQYLWQVLVEEGWLRCVNPATHDFERTLVVEGATRLGGVAYDGEQLWVVDQAGALLALGNDTGLVRRQIAVPAAGGGLAWRAGQLWLAVPLTMRYEPLTGAFSWTTAKESFAVLVLDVATGVEVARHPLSFLPMGLAWDGDDLWLSHSAAGRLYRARLG